MLDFALFQDFLLSVAMGGLIGIERTMPRKGREVQSSSTVPSYALISLLGALTAYLAGQYSPYVLVIGFGGFFIFTSTRFYLEFKKTGDAGVSSEITMLLLFTLGALVFVDVSLALALGIVAAILLELEGYANRFAKRITEKEFQDTLKFALIALVILPLLPNQQYGPLDFFNPYEAWVVVVLVSGIGYVGYVLMKALGARIGLALTGILGGLTSSTAVTSAMANEVKKSEKVLYPAVFATISANSVMCLRLIFFITALGMPTTSFRLPAAILAMAVVGTGISAYFWFKKAREEVEFEARSPFRIGPALKFGLFFALIILVSKAAQIYVGDMGLYVTGLVSGLADVDAITVSMARLAGSDIAAAVAENTIFIAALSNLIVKAGIARSFGSRKFGREVGLSLGVMAVVGLSVLLFL